MGCLPKGYTELPAAAAAAVEQSQAYAEFSLDSFAASSTPFAFLSPVSHSPHSPPSFPPPPPPSFCHRSARPPRLRHSLLFSSGRPGFSARLRTPYSTMPSTFLHH